MGCLSGIGAGGRCRQQRAVRPSMCGATNPVDSSLTCSRSGCPHLPRSFVSPLATIPLRLLFYRHADQGKAATGDPQGAGAGAVLATAAASRVGRGDTRRAHADAGLQPAAERDRMVRGATRGSGPGDAGLSPAGAAPFPHGHHDPLPGRGEGVVHGTRVEGRPVPRREGAGSGSPAAAGGQRRPPASMSALRGVVLAGAQARILRALLPVRHGAQQGPPGEGEGGAGRQKSSVARYRLAGSDGGRCESRRKRSKGDL